MQFIWDIAQMQPVWFWEVNMMEAERSRQTMERSLAFWSVAVSRLGAKRKDLKNQLPEIITLRKEYWVSESGASSSSLSSSSYKHSGSYTQTHLYSFFVLCLYPTCVFVPVGLSLFAAGVTYSSLGVAYFSTLSSSLPRRGVTVTPLPVDYAPLSQLREGTLLRLLLRLSSGESLGWYQSGDGLVSLKANQCSWLTFW